MFNIEEVQYRPWPVTVDLSGFNEDGEFVMNVKKFVALWRPVTEVEINTAKIESEKEFKPSGDSDGQGGQFLTYADILKRNNHQFAALLHGWAKVDDKDGNAIAYSLSGLSSLVLGTHGLAFSKGLHESLDQLRFSQFPAVEKNSETSPSPGPAVSEEAASS